MDTTIIKNNSNIGCHSRIYASWSAIFAGVVVGLATESLLGLLGLGLGFVSFTGRAGVMGKISTGSIVWLVVCAIFSMAIAGWVVGRLSGLNCKLAGALHGLVAWALATLFTFALMANVVGTIIGGTVGVMEGAFSLAGQGALSTGKTAAQIAPQAVEQVKNIFPDVTATINEAKQQAEHVLNNFKKGAEQIADETKNQLRENLTILLTSDIKNDKAEARQKIVGLLAQETNMNQEQIDKAINDWQQKYAQMKEKVNQKAAEAKQKVITGGTQVVNILGSLSLMAFFILILGAVASAVGGAYGTKETR